MLVLCIDSKDSLVAPTLDSNSNSLHARQESKTVLLGVGGIKIALTDGSTFHGFNGLSFRLEEYLGLGTNEHLGPVF